MVTHESDSFHEVMCEGDADYLINIGSVENQKMVSAYIGKEDPFQRETYLLNFMNTVKLESDDTLHNHSCFVALGAINGTRGTHMG